MNWKERKIHYIALVISILLHFLLLLFITDFDLFAFSQERTPQLPEPLELVFQQPANELKTAEPIPERFYEVVENPNATNQTPEASDMLSTGASRSQAPVIMPGQIRAVPGSDNEKTGRSSPEQDPEMTEKMQDALQKSILAYKENRAFNRSVLTGQAQSPQSESAVNTDQGQGETLERPAGFNAELVGEFALSTYEWDWAPYWLTFKRKLERVWNAPPAYSQLGLIHGHTILRFKVRRDGSIFDLEVLRQVGHTSLEQSSVSAIQAVFPFQALPSSFPDEYLEVTIKMIYPNLREYNITGTQE